MWFWKLISVVLKDKLIFLNRNHCQGYMKKWTGNTLESRWNFNGDFCFVKRDVISVLKWCVFSVTNALVLKMLINWWTKIQHLWWCYKTNKNELLLGPFLSQAEKGIVLLTWCHIIFLFVLILSNQETRITKEQLQSSSYYLKVHFPAGH